MMKTFSMKFGHPQKAITGFFENKKKNKQKNKKQKTNKKKHPSCYRVFPVAKDTLLLVNRGLDLD